MAVNAESQKTIKGWMEGNKLGVDFDPPIPPVKLGRVYKLGQRIADIQTAVEPAPEKMSQANPTPTNHTETIVYEGEAFGTVQERPLAFLGHLRKISEAIHYGVSAQTIELRFTEPTQPSGRHQE